MSGSGVLGLDHAGITVSDLDRSLRFYVDRLGFEVLRRRDGLDLPHIRRLVGFPDAVLNVAMLAVPGGAKLELVQYVTPAGSRWPSAANGRGVVHVAFRVTGIEELIARLRSAGVDVVSDAQRSPAGPTEGYRFVYLRDPDGAILEFVEPAGPPT